MQTGLEQARHRISSGRLPLWGTAVVVVTLLHLGVGLIMGRTGKAPVPEAFVQVVLVELVAPSPPIPQVQEPEVRVTPIQGGGAPAAPSRLHVPPPRPVLKPELPLAPVELAPEPEIVLGRAPTSEARPGLGEGGTGDGQGAGRGSGDGLGQGSGPAFLRGASHGEILSMMPSDLARRRGGGRSAVRCIIGRDTRLRDCQVVSEQPAGLGYGPIAARIAETYFRFRPPTNSRGEVIEGQAVTVGIDFPGR